MVEHKQWEYYIETIGSTFRGANDEDLSALLAELGQEGWEVFSLVQLETSSKVRVAAKRPVRAQSNPRKSSWP